MLRMGIDLAGTKIEIIAFDDNGNALLRWRVAAPQGDSSGVRGAAWFRSGSDYRNAIIGEAPR